MVDERIVITFSTEGIPQSQRDINQLQNNAIGGFTELNNAFEVFQKALGGVQKVATVLYSALIDSNEKLNAELLKSQTNLASNLEIFKDGDQIVDITEKITSTQEVLRQSLKQIEKDTVDLVGVTTEQVNGVFQVLLQNSQKFIGQSQEFRNPIEAATASTKNWAAALGTLGLPLEQANQEIRSILQGDVNNPDSVIAKTLQISREQYDVWVANGELIDRLNDKLEVFTAGNALASRSIAGITSNLQSFFEDTARLVGADLLGPVVDSLNTIYKILVDNRSLIEELAGDNVQELLDLFKTLENVTKGVGESLNIDAEGFLVTGSETISAIISATEGLIVLGGGLAELFGPGLTRAFTDTLGVINLSLEGIGKLTTLLGQVTSKVADFTNAVSDILPDIGIGDVLSEAQAGVARLTGEYGQSVEAVKTYADVTSVLLAQTEKLTTSEKANADQIKGQIEQLQQQKKEISEVKTFRDEDAASIEKQKAAIDKAIVGLEEMAAKTEALTFKAKDLQDLGTILEDLQQKANSASTTIKNQGAGDVAVFNEAVATITELTEKQVEYGQITITEAKERLEAILNNNKVELEAREGALNTLKSLEQDYTDFKIGLLDEEIGVLERRAQVGEISAIESAEGQYQAENEQIKLQLDLLDQQIERQEGLGMSSEKLLAERESLVNKSLQLEVDYSQTVGDLQQEQVEESYNRTLGAAKSAEVARTTALKEALLERSVSQEQFDQQNLVATQARLQTELEAERNNIAAIESLLATAGTADQRKELQGELDASRLKSLELYQQTIDTELSLQKQAEVAAQDAYDKQSEAARRSYGDVLEVVESGEVAKLTALKQGLKSGEITQEEYAARELAITQESLNSQYQAELDNIARLETLLEGALSSDQRVAAQEELDQARLKSQAIYQQTVDTELSIQNQASEAIKGAYDKRVEVAQDAYKESTAVVESGEVAQSSTLKQQLLAREITQEGYATKSVQLTKDTLDKQYQAELDNITRLEGLLDQAPSNEQRVDIQAEIDAARLKSQQVYEQVIDAELSLQQQSDEALKASYDKKVKTAQEAYQDTLEAVESGELAQTTLIKQAVLSKELSKAESEAKLLQLTKESLDKQYQAELDNISRLEGLVPQASSDDQRVAIQSELDAARLKSKEIYEQVIESEIKLQQQSEAVLRDNYAKKLKVAQEAYQNTLETVETGEIAQVTAIKQALLAKEISKADSDAKILQVTQDSLNKQYQAELDNIKRLEGIQRGSLGSDQRVAIQEELDQARLKSQQLNQQIVESEINLLDQQEAKAKKVAQEQVKAVEDQYNQTKGVIDSKEAEVTNKLKQNLADRTISQEVYTQRVLEVQEQRLTSELKANQKQQEELSKLLETSTEKEALEKALNQVKVESLGIESQLIDLELQGAAKSIEATKEAVSERSRLMGLEYSEKEAIIRRTVESESEAQSKIAELGVERINKQIEAEKAAQAQLSALGDTEGVNESKIKLRELAIDLIDAEIRAEESLQGVIEWQLETLKEKLDIKRQTSEVDLLEDELKLAQAVTDGVLTKEQAERAKLDLTKDRVAKEIELLQQLAGKGNEEDQLRNRQEILRNQIELEGVEQKIVEADKAKLLASKTQLVDSKALAEVATKTTTAASKQLTVEEAIKKQIESIGAKYQSNLSIVTEQVAQLKQVEALSALHNQSNQRQLELKQAQLSLIAAQGEAVSSGLDNELSLVNQSLQVRQKLNAVTEELNSKDEIGPERRLELEKESQALRSQLSVLGVDGAKQENELIEKRQVIQRQQLEAEKVKLDLSRQTATLEISNQRVLIGLDLIKAKNQAEVLKLDAESLKLQAAKIRAEAALTTDTAKRVALLDQAKGIEAQVGRTLELSEAQVKAAETESEVRNQILDRQVEVQEIQYESQRGQLETQRTLLESQQAYESATPPKIDTTGIDKYTKGLEGLKGRISEVNASKLKVESDSSALKGIEAKVSDLNTLKVTIPYTTNPEISQDLKEIKATTVPKGVQGVEPKVKPVERYTGKVEELGKLLTKVSKTEVEPKLETGVIDEYMGRVATTVDQIQEPIEPIIGTKGVERLGTKLKEAKREIEGIASGAKVGPISIPINVKPANLEIKVSQESGLNSAINKLTTNVSRQTEALAVISRTVTNIKDKMGQSAVQQNSAGPSEVKTNITVKVQSCGSQEPKVTVESLLSQRSDKCSL